MPTMNPRSHDAVRALIGAPIPPVHLDVREFDHTTSPRTDLEAFVNARWRATRPVPPDRSSWDCFSILAERSLQICAEVALDAAHGGPAVTHAQRVVGDFWRSGMDEAAIHALGLEPLREELARIDAIDTRAAVASYLADRHARGCGLLFGFEVAPDFEDPDASMAYIFQGGLGLPDRDFYVDTTPRGDGRRLAYRTHIATMLALAGVPEPTAAEQAHTVLAFETRLASASLPRRSLARDLGLNYRRISLDDADRQHPMFGWSAFFAAQGIAPPPYFSLAMPAFHATFDAMLREVPIATWRAYLRFHTLDAAAVYLDDATAAAHHRFHGEFLRGQPALGPRWKRVLRAIDANIGEAMGQLYVARTFPPAARKAVEQLTEHLRAALQARLERLDWMSAPTKAAALRKLAAMRVRIGGPAHRRDWSELATVADGWYANILIARAHNQRWMLARLGKPVDRSVWPMLPQTVNASYDPQRNEIMFPAAILQPPFFAADADDALNFGGIGAVIAHEMTHAFDDQGSRFDADGRFANWWSAVDRGCFEAAAQRLVDQFESSSGFPGATAAAADAMAAECGEPDQRASVDGRLTLGENIADFGGLAIAGDALQARLAAADGPDPMHDGYSQTQRFFLNWAVIWRQNLTPDERRLRLCTDPHAPAALRANAAASNLAAYAAVFGCRPGDRMWRTPADRIGLW